MESTVDTNPPSLQDRVKRIITDPKAEWPVIEREPTTVEKLYREYIALLAAIPVLAGLVGGVLIGGPTLFGWSRTPVVAGVIGAIVGYLLALVGVYIAAFIVDKLAPTFDSQPNQMQALKLVAYAYTPAWVAGIAYLIPGLGTLIVLLGSLFSIYLFYLGLPVMMKTPQAKVIPYMLVAAVVIIILTFLLMMIVGLATAPFLLMGAAVR
jgi:hypothetical protein